MTVIKKPMRLQMGELIHHLRITRKMTGRVFSELTGIAVETLIDYEKGSAPIIAEHIPIMARVLGVPVVRLLYPDDMVYDNEFSSPFYIRLLDTCLALLEICSKENVTDLVLENPSVSFFQRHGEGLYDELDDVEYNALMNYALETMNLFCDKPSIVVPTKTLVDKLQSVRDVAESVSNNYDTFVSTFQKLVLLDAPSVL